jgi:hypothetical protein
MEAFSKNMKEMIGWRGGSDHDIMNYIWGISRYQVLSYVFYVVWASFHFIDIVLHKSNFPLKFPEYEGKQHFYVNAVRLKELKCVCLNTDTSIPTRVFWQIVLFTVYQGISLPWCCRRQHLLVIAFLPGEIYCRPQRR